jgi:hypothetical protein
VAVQLGHRLPVSVYLSSSADIPVPEDWMSIRNGVRSILTWASRAVDRKYGRQKENQEEEEDQEDADEVAENYGQEGGGDEEDD